MYSTVTYSTMCICVIWQRKNCYLAKQCPSSSSFAEISFPQQLSGPSSSSPPGCSTPDQLSQLLSIPRLEHRWTLRHHSKAISNIATCVGFKHCPWSQRLKVLRTAKRLLKEQGRTFTLEGYFSLCRLFSQNKNFEVSRCSNHYTEEKEKIRELNSKLLWGDFIPHKHRAISMEGQSLSQVVVWPSWLTF